MKDSNAMLERTQLRGGMGERNREKMKVEVEGMKQ